MNIKEIVYDDLIKVIEENDIESVFQGLFFEKGCASSMPGDYLYKEGSEYCLMSVGDRGGIAKLSKSKELRDLLYIVYKNILFNEGVKFALKGPEKGEDTRKAIFERQLELLKQIDCEYYSKRLKEISGILENHPYCSK